MRPVKLTFSKPLTININENIQGLVLFSEFDFTEFRSKSDRSKLDLDSSIKKTVSDPTENPDP